MLLLLLFNAIKPLRLIHLPNSRNLLNKFIANINDQMVFSDGKNHLDAMYTIIHKRKLYFYTRGVYYNFKLCPDQTTVELARKIDVKKVEYYTWERSEVSSSEPKRINYMALQPKKENDLNGDGKYKSYGRLTRKKENQESTPPGNTKGDLFKEYESPVKKPKHKDEPAESVTHSEEANDSEEPDPSEETQPTQPTPIRKKTRKVTNRIPHKARKIQQPKSIESDDSDSISPGQFDLTVATIDYGKKTFSLKKDGLCLAYFMDRFILTGCNKAAENQVFGLVSVEEGSRMLKDCDTKVPKKLVRIDEDRKSMAGINKCPHKKPAPINAKMERPLAMPIKKKEESGKIESHDTKADKKDVQSILMSIDDMLERQLR